MFVLQVVKEQRGDTLLVKFSGSIEEGSDIAALVGPTSAQQMDFILKEVTRINSVGVKAWIKYFQSLAAKGVKMRYLECSTAIVEQINLISNFTAGALVESIYAPYNCAGCGTELLALFRAEDLKKINFEVPQLKCGKCGGLAAFDDVPEEYFGFLTR